MASFDASTVFVLVTTIVMFGVIAWAEVYSRRQHQQSASTAAPASPPPAATGAKARRPKA